MDEGRLKPPPREGTLRKESAQVFRAVDLPVSVDPDERQPS